MPRFILSLFLVLFVSQGAFAQSAAFSPLRPNAFPPSMNGSQTQPLPQRIQAQIDAIHHQLARKGTQQTSGRVHSDGSSVTMRIIAGQIPDPAGKSPLDTELAAPGGAVADSSGNLYISDSSFSIILKVTPGGAVSIFAGTGSLGYSGDNGPATSAMLGYIINMTLDSGGNLYFSDNTYNVVRKINLASGVISLYAGTPGVSGYTGDNGPATQAELGLPWGLTTDSSNNLYIADPGQFVVREVAASTGTITTVAGGGGFGSGCTGSTDYLGDGCLATQAFTDPFSVAVFGTTVYIGDALNEVRAVNTATGIITAVAGTAFDSGPSGDGGPASEALVGIPYAMLTDSVGDLYFVDTERVREINTAAIINTVAGDGSGGFSGDGGVATAASIEPTYQLALLNNSTLIIGDTGNNRIREVTNVGPSGIIQTIVGNGYSNYYGNGGPATSAGLSSPSGISEDAAGNLYIADSLNNAVRRIDAVSGGITTIAGTGLTPYAYTMSGAAATSQAVSPYAIAVDAAGDVFIPNDFSVAEISASTGDITEVPGSPLVTGYGSIALDNSGNVYYTTGNQVAYLSPVTGAVTVLANSSNTNGYSGDGQAALDAELASPYGVALDGKGNLYVADSDNYRVRVINLSTGIINTIAGNGTEGYTGDNGPAISAEIGFAYNVATDPSGNILFPDLTHGVVREINVSSGNITTIVGTGTLGYNGPGLAPTATDLSVTNVYEDTLGNLFIVDSGNELVWLDASKLANLLPVLVSSITSAPVGSTVTLSVSFKGPRFGVAPTGSVAFQLGGNTFATANLSNGTASLTQSTAGLAPGSYTITAHYSGDANYAAASSAAVAITLSPVPTTATLAASPNPVNSGAAVQLKVTTKETSGTGVPTGTVSFYSGSTFLASATLSTGVATLNASTAGYPLGSYPITGKYSGDSTNAASSSNTVTVAIEQATKTTVTATPNPVPAGGTVKLQATVVPTSGSGVPTGTVTFKTGSTTLATVTLSGGTASLSAPTSGYPAGTYPVVATYNGGPNYTSSASSVVNVVIQ